MADEKLNEMYGKGSANDAALRAKISEQNRQAAKYKGHYGYDKMKKVYEDRTEIVRSDLARRPKKRKIRKDRVAIAGAVGALATLGLIHSFGGGDKPDHKSPHSINDPSVQIIKELEIDYEWTNMYSQPPEYNKLQTLHYGDIIKYDPVGIGYYNEENGTIAKVSRVEAQNPQTKWDTCYDDDNNIKGFVPDEYVAKYTAYTLNPEYEKAFYRTNYTLSNPDEKITTGTTVYIKDDSPMINQDSIMLYPMIIINQDKNHSAVENGENDIESNLPQYITGYIELGKLEKVKDEENIGCIVAQKTFLRSTPFVTELDESIIMGQIKKGERISVVDEVQQGMDKWYKCISGDTMFYVADYTTKPIIEKEVPDESIEPAISKQDSTNESKDKITYLLDMSSYTTFDSFKFHVDDLIAHDCMGGVVLEIGKTLQKAEFAQKCMYESNTNESEGNGVSSNKKLQDYYNEINTHFVAGQNEKNKNFEKLEDIEKYIEYLVKNDVPVGFYYYSCAINLNEASAEAAYIYALEKKLYQDIPELKNAKVLPITIDIEDADSNSSSKSKQKYFEEFPGKTDQDYYHYIRFTNRNGKKEERAEAVAQIIQLLGNGTNNPNCWCIDGVDSKNGYGLLKDNQVTIYSGTNQTALKNEYSAQSLYINSLEDLEAKVPDYKLIHWQTRNVYFDYDSYKAGKEKVFDDKGNFIRYKSFDYSDARIQSDFLDYGIVETINNNGYYCIKPNESEKIYACKNAEAGDIMQVALNLNFDKRDGKTQCIDISATNQYTIDAILDGTYTHTETFVDKINRVYNIQIEDKVNDDIDDMYLE